MVGGWHGWVGGGPLLRLKPKIGMRITTSRSTRLYFRRFATRHRTERPSAMWPILRSWVFGWPVHNSGGLYANAERAAGGAVGRRARRIPDTHCSCVSGPYSIYAGFGIGRRCGLWHILFVFTEASYWDAMRIARPVDD